MKFQEKCELLEKEQIKNDIYKFKIKTEHIAKEAKPGQFLEIRVSDEIEPFLRRPISIYSIDDNNIEFIFQIKGKGTNILSKKKIGEKIDIIGPLGNGTFTIKEYNNVAIIGGGIGIYPLYEAAKELKGKTKISMYLGFRNKDYVTSEKEFKEIADKLVITTDDGSYGEKGFAIDYLKKAERPDIIMACGPLPMLKAIQEYSKEIGVPCQISLEERMGCGLGACLGCAVKKANKSDTEYWHVCKDGPVFDANKVEL